MSRLNSNFEVFCSKHILSRTSWFTPEKPGVRLFFSAQLFKQSSEKQLQMPSGIIKVYCFFFQYVFAMRLEGAAENTAGHVLSF